eukprot:1218162-Prorocentrum_lima.AAC.1
MENVLCARAAVALIWDVLVSLHHLHVAWNLRRELQRVNELFNVLQPNRLAGRRHPEHLMIRVGRV